MSQELNINDLITIFNRVFREQEKTELHSGGEEPIYLPADQDYPYHRIICTNDYFESGLHEISHWCIAGSARRLLVDFGYWYEPDGRSLEQQRAFESVEVKPQALEWILSEACGRRFRVSIDNLHGDYLAIEESSALFKQRVWQQVQDYWREGLPPRADVLKQALLDYYQRHHEFSLEAFRLDRI